MENLYPEAFARFYDVIYNSLRDGVDNKYYLEKIAAVKGRILEVGAGTGRLFIPALLGGADIYAIDNSPAMMEVLKEKIESNLHSRLLVQDIRTLSHDHKFDLILAPFRVFGHLLTTADQITVLNNIYDHLNPGGRFIFDLYVPDPGILSKGFQDHVDFEGEYKPGLPLKRSINSWNDIVNQINHIEFILEWKENNRMESKSWKCDLRFFFRYELEHLIRLSSFDKFRLYGDFHESPLNESSREFIIHCDRI